MLNQGQLDIIGIIAGILPIVAAVPYIKDILKGTTKPNMVTWLIWVVLQAVALAAQIASGGRASLFLTIGDLIVNGTILVLALFRGQAKWHWIDKVALCAAAVGLILWYILNQPIWALVFTVFVDFCGLIPTLRKSYVDPGSETLQTWLIVGSGAILGAIAVGSFNVTLLIYPVYLAVANLGVAVAILLGRMHKQPVSS